MLILTRRIGESIVASDSVREVRITVLAVRSNHVRLGFEAPADVAIHREEVHHRIKRERSEEAGPPARHDGG